VEEENALLVTSLGGWCTLPLSVVHLCFPRIFRYYSSAYGLSACLFFFLVALRSGGLGYPMFLCVALCGSRLLFSPWLIPSIAFTAVDVLDASQYDGGHLLFFPFAP